MSQRSPLIVPNERTTHPTEASAAPLFVCDTVQRTVLKFVEPLFDQQTIAAPTHSKTVLAAMQRLVDMINTLRSSPLASPGGAAKQRLSEAQTLEALFSYVSEEAYDVLEALRSGKTRHEQHLDCKTQTTSDPSGNQSNGDASRFRNADRKALRREGHTQRFSILHPSPPHLHAFVTLETLIPTLLWRLVRSSYSTMQLIEGVRGSCWQLEQGWVFGMLRLVVMLEAETPTERWCFDIATGYPADKLLEPTAIIQADDPVLPVQPPVSAEDGSSNAACQVDHQLMAILQSLQAERLGLNALLQGVAVELLQPEAGWLAGNLRLRLGFEFSAQTAIANRHDNARLHPELIEAELVDEAIGITQERGLQCSGESVMRTIAGLITKTQISVVNPVDRALSATTLVYVTDVDSLKRHTPPMTRQQCAQSLMPLQHQHAEDESTQLTLIVQAAIAHVYQSDAIGMGLLQPMLLMDELVPKLLWSLTSRMYEIMQLLGGVPAHVLQPHANWQQGTLRLVAALHLKAADVDYSLDLSTGRAVLIHTPQLALDAIVQTSAAECSQPMLIETLTAHLQQQLSEAMSEYNLLRDGVAIAWLEDVEQDWQIGSMQLSLSLAFIADAL